MWHRHLRPCLARAAAALALLATVVAASVAWAGSARPGIRVSQESVTVETGARSTVVAFADGASPHARLRVIADGGVRATARPAGDGRWLVAVGLERGVAAEKLLTLELRDGVQVPEFAQVKVVPRPAASADAMAQATLVLDGDDLMEGPDLQGFVTVANRGEQALNVGVPHAIAPPGLKLAFGARHGLVLPGRTLVIPFSVSVSGEVATAPGRHVVGVSVPVTTDLDRGEAVAAGATAGRRGWSADLVATRELTVSIPGVSAVQGAFQIPSLLLLPGMLFLATFWSLFSMARPNPAGADPLARLSFALSPAVWVVIVMLSGVIGLAYGIVTGRNVLYAFGLRDVVWLWFGSILLGSVAGAIAYCRERKLQTRAAAPRFAPTADPMEVLSTLSREGHPWRARVAQSGGALLFDLGPGPDAARVWACGAISSRPTGAQASAVRDAIAREDVAGLRRQLQSGAVELSFSPFDAGGETVAGPRLVSIGLFAGPVYQDGLVQEAIA